MSVKSCCLNTYIHKTGQKCTQYWSCHGCPLYRINIIFICPTLLPSLWHKYHSITILNRQAVSSYYSMSVGKCQKLCSIHKLKSISSSHEAWHIFPEVGPWWNMKHQIFRLHFNIQTEAVWKSLKNILSSPLSE